MFGKILFACVLIGGASPAYAQDWWVINKSIAQCEAAGALFGQAGGPSVIDPATGKAFFESAGDTVSILNGQDTNGAYSVTLDVKPPNGGQEIYVPFYLTLNDCQNDLRAHLEDGTVIKQKQQQGDRLTTMSFLEGTIGHWSFVIFALVSVFYIFIALPTYFMPGRIRIFSIRLLFIFCPVLMICLWIGCFFESYDISGWLGTLIGLILFGVGVIPLALIEEVFSGLWINLAINLVMLALPASGWFLVWRAQEKLMRNST